MKTELRDEEHVIRSGASNLQRGMETVGGHLYLTNVRLIFEAHRFNIQSKPEEIRITDIKATEKCWTRFLGLIPLAPNSLAVHTSSNEEYRFVLGDRDGWANAIQLARNSELTHS